MVPTRIGNNRILYCTGGENHVPTLVMAKMNNPNQVLVQSMISHKIICINFPYPHTFQLLTIRECQVCHSEQVGCISVLLLVQ